jgi:mannosyl-oligosaccharide alpha-1,2-mannosidase
MPTRRTVVASAALLPFATRARAAPPVDWHALGADVRGEMAWAWDQYRARAWGKDQIRPVSGGYESFPLKTRHLGLSLIEAMDTLWVMGLDDRFADALAWVKASLSFDVDGEVSVFETSIRLVGGLLSAWHACGDPALLAHARDLADRLRPAFATPTGLPYRYVNLKTGAVRDPRTNPAESGTFIPEWGLLSQATGDPVYRETAMRALRAVYAARSPIGLVPDTIDALTGKALSRRATVGPPSDSFYEYLWDGWQFLGIVECRTMYDACTAAILSHQRATIDGRLWFVDVDTGTGARLTSEQDELSSFYGGLLAQGGAGATGAAYTLSWASVQDRLRVLPEGYDPTTGRATSVTNALRPELADAAFNHWLLDRDERWRAIGRTHYLAMKATSRATYGYADIADVTATPMTQSDHCPGYWWSEQMKYYYLLFSDTPRFDYARNYLSTEGNVLLGLRGAASRRSSAAERSSTE